MSDSGVLHTSIDASQVLIMYHALTEAGPSNVTEVSKNKRHRKDKRRCDGLQCESWMMLRRTFAAWDTDDIDQ